MSDRCQQCGEVPNPDGSCACPKQVPNSLAATIGSAPVSKAAVEAAALEAGEGHYPTNPGIHVQRAIDAAVDEATGPLVDALISINAMGADSRFTIAKDAVMAHRSRQNAEVSDQP